MDRTPHIYLIPGFLGFANLGRITYFGHVRRILATRLAAAGLDARIHIVHTPPTASLPSRAARVAATIAATAGDGGPLHLIGHSSVGLDARLFTAPEVALPTSLVTGSGFDSARFEALWSDVTRFLTAGADATEVPASAARMSRHASDAIALSHKA